MNRGFTLIETFVAITILVFAVLGPMALLSRAISDGNYAKNQITAYYLAQEAIEYVINNRDSKFLESKRTGVPLDQEWFRFDGSENICYQNWCQVDVHSDGSAVNACDIEDEESCQVYQDPDREDYYVHSTLNSPGVGSGLTPTIFRRAVKIEPVGNATQYDGNVEVKITSKVVWQNKETPRELEMVTYMFQQH